MRLKELYFFPKHILYHLTLGHKSRVVAYTGMTVYHGMNMYDYRIVHSFLSTVLEKK